MDPEGLSSPRGHSLALKHDHFGKNAVARLELLGSRAIHSPGAYREGVAVDLVYPGNLRKFLLVGTAEIDPVEFTGRSRLINLDFALGPEADALRRLDIDINAAALDVQARPGFPCERPPGGPSALEAAQIAVGRDRLGAAGQRLRSTKSSRRPSQ